MTRKPSTYDEIKAALDEAKRQFNQDTLHAHEMFKAALAEASRQALARQVKHNEKAQRIFSRTLCRLRFKALREGVDLTAG